MNDVVAPKTIVLIDGVARDVVSWSVDRELIGDLPEQVVAASGITQATGTVEFAGDEVERASRNPFNRALGWLPRRGQRVQVLVDVAGVQESRFVGVIDKVSGTVSGGFRASIIDESDKLSAKVSHVPLQRIMPPLADGDPRRGVGLTALYYIDLACRAAGFYCTPRREHNTSLTANLQTSLWPEAGTLDSTTAVGGQSHGVNRPAPWGMGLSSFNALYAPWGEYTSSDALQMTMVVAPNHTGIAYVEVPFQSGSTPVMLRIDGARTASLRINGVQVAALPLGEALVVSALITGGQVKLRTDKGAEATGSGSITGGLLGLIRVYADASANVAGVQVSHPDTPERHLASTYWEPNAILDTRSVLLMGAIDAAPRIDGVSAGDLLNEVSRAILTASWIDEDGIMRAVPSNVLREQTPRRTVTTLDDVLSLDWEDGVLQSPSKVTVRGRKPTLTTNRWRNVVVWEGGSAELRSGETYEQFVEPASDEDWVLPQEIMAPVGGFSSASWQYVNGNVRTVGGGYFSIDGGDIPENPSYTFTVKMEVLGITRYKISIAVSEIPSNVLFNIETSPNHPALWENKRSKPLPRINAYGRTQWTDEEVSAVSVSGPGPELVHESGPWAARPDSTETIGVIADYIAGQTAASQPIITGLEIVPDPSLRLGDIITIRSDALMEVTMDALITGISESFGPSGLSQELSVRIISVTARSTTYEAWQAALSSGEVSYSAFNTLAPAPESYQQFNSAIN